MLEKTLKRKVKKRLVELAKLGDLWFWFVQDRFTSGIPDIIGVYRGRFFAIELKKPGDHHITRLQSIVLRLISLAGGFSSVVSTEEEFEKFICRLIKTN